MKKCLAKSVFAILLLCVFVCVNHAQNDCELASKSAPLLLNLKIGMSPEETQTIFGKDLRIKIKKNGERTIFQNYIKKPAPQSLNGVRALYLRFFDKRLYQIEIFYEPRTDLKSVKEITDAISSQMNLREETWQIQNNFAKTICGEISLTADNVLNPRIEITDESIRAKIEEKRKEKSKR